jgi:hypothetical protein
MVFWMAKNRLGAFKKQTSKEHRLNKENIRAFDRKQQYFLYEGTRSHRKDRFLFPWK